MDKRLQHLLLRYITKEASPEECAWVKAWLAQSDENEQLYIKLYQTYHSHLSAQHQFIDSNKALKRFYKENATPKIVRLPLLVRYAAIIIAVITSATLFTTFNTAETNLWETTNVAKAQKNKVTLPDGTKVYLNAGSTIKYNKDFGKTQRCVVLDGEAYFDIAKSKNNIPFILDAGGYIIRDIGTIFKIKAYAEDHQFESYVVEGEISVESKTPFANAKRIYLKKNQLLKLSEETLLANKTPVKANQVKSLNSKLVKTPLPELQPETYDDWIQGNFIFDNTSFEQIINDLERQFNLDIKIMDESLKDYRYTGKFENVKNIFQILEIIKQNTPISYSLSGKTLIINKLTKN